MEFEKAQELGRPTLIFVMGDDHAVKPGHVELDPDKIQKLQEFRKRAKEGRIYVPFNDIDEFKEEALLAVCKLKKLIEEKVAAEFVGASSSLPESEPLQAAATTEFDPKFSCFNVPFRSKGDGVIGRDGILEKIRGKFQSEDGTPFGKLVSLVGLGGLGKTQLAVEFAYRYREEYSGGVVWLGADEDIDSQLTWLSEEAKWVSPVSDHKTKLDVALNRIRSRSDCLIVFDNLEDFERIRSYLPRVEATPHLLLTSQREVLGIPSIDVDFLDPESSRALLVREAGGSPTAENDEAVAEILEHLDGLPLALEMAGAFIKRLHLEWKTYLGQLKERPRRTLKGTALGSFTNHDPDVFATLRVSERVLDEDPLLRKAIDVLTWSGSADMGIGLLSSLVGCADGDLIPSLMTAVNVRLIRKHPRLDRYSLHRLLQLARRENAETPDFEIWQGEIAQRLGDWFEHRRENFADLAAFEAEFDHLDAWKLRSALISDELHAKLIWLQAYPPYHRGRNQQSHELVSEAASILENVTGECPALKASILSDLGYTENALGRPEKARELAQMALNIRRDTLGEKHPDTASSYGNLGGAFIKLGESDKVLELAQRALDIWLAICGENHSDTASAYGNLGSAFGGIGDHQKGLEMTQKALDIKLATVGEDHPDTATSYGNLGSAFDALGKHETALELKKKCLDIKLATLGEDHPSTASAYGSLGNTYYTLGKHDTALELVQKSLNIRLATLGEDHPETAKAYGNLGATLSALGEHGKALEMKNKALAIRLASLGEDHPDTATAYGSLGNTYYSLGKYAEALEFGQKAHQICKAILGDSHESTRNCAINIAMSFGALNRIEEARSFLNAASCSLPVTHAIYKRAQKVSVDLKRKMKKRGSRYTPPKPQRKRKRR